MAPRDLRPVASGRSVGRPSLERPREDEWGMSGPSLGAALWRYRYLVVAATLLLGAVGFLASQSRPALYEAEGFMLLSDPNETTFRSTRGFVDPGRHASREAERLRTAAVLEQASELLGGRPTPEQLDGMLSVEPGQSVESLTIRAFHRDPKTAAEVVNAVAEAYELVIAQEIRSDAESAIARLNESRQEVEEELRRIQAQLSQNPDDPVLSARMQAATQQLSAISSRADEIAVDSALFGSGVEVFQQARPPTDPASPQPAVFAALLGLIGAGAATAFAYWRTGRDRSITDRAQPAALLGAPLLGAVPEDKGVADGLVFPLVIASLGPYVEEAYQFVASSLQHVLGETDGRTVLFTSPLEGDGKTTAALCVAAIANGMEGRVALVDADLRVGRLSRLAESEKRRGLVELAEAGTYATDCVSSLGVRPTNTTRVTTLSFVPRGRTISDPGSFFRSDRFGKALVGLRERNDLILIDTPPVLAVADTLSMAAHVDGVVLVIREGTSVDTVADARARLELVGARILGYVFNRDARRRGQAYAYAYSDTAPSRRGRKRAR